MLIRSLIDCLFGTAERREEMESGWDGHSIRISYGRYPTLPGVLLSLLRPGQTEALDSEAEPTAAEAVFPALDIIRRAGPPEHLRERLYDCVVNYLSSRLWHVREMAARTICSFLLRSDWVAAIEVLIDESRGCANRLQGSLLTARYILERKMELSGSLLVGACTPLPAVASRCR